MSARYATLPAWVYKRDGRLAPFNPDEIALGLFEATEKTGTGNTFLARELTESALFFLGEETRGHIPSTATIAEVVAKVVRELGYPNLAKEFLAGSSREIHPGKVHPEKLFPITASDSPSSVIRKSLSNYSLNNIFSRDLIAAQEDGWITILGLTAPMEILAGVMDPATQFPAERFNSPFSQSREWKNFWLIHALENTRNLVGEIAAIDGPEHTVSGNGESTEEIANFFQQLEIGLKGTGLKAVLNLNCFPPPSWVEAGTEGPLFALAQTPEPNREGGSAAEVFLDYANQPDSVPVGVFFDWHLHEAVFQGWKKGQAVTRLGRLTRLVLEQRSISFSFDRPRQPVYLAPGLDRKVSTTLIAVNLHLPRLLAFSEARTDPEIFLKKIPSLVRLAVSAGVQKRSFLRDRGRLPDGSTSAVNRRFLLARSRLLVIPVGLEAVVRELLNRGLCESPAALQFAQTLLKTIKECLQDQSQSYNLPACLGGLGDAFSVKVEWGKEGQLTDTQPPMSQVSDLTPWDSNATFRDQLRVAGKLHPFGEGATATVLIPHDRSPSGEEVAELLWFAWKETAIQRLQFRKMGQYQMTLMGL